MKGKVAVRFVELLVEIPEFFFFFSLSLCFGLPQQKQY